MEAAYPHAAATHVHPQSKSKQHDDAPHSIIVHGKRRGATDSSNCLVPRPFSSKPLLPTPFQPAVTTMTTRR